MDVTIQIPADESLGVTHDAESRLVSEVANLGFAVQPLFPGAVKPDLCRFFIVHVPDRRVAKRLISAVMERGLADQAYVKPPPHPA